MDNHFYAIPRASSASTLVQFVLKRLKREEQRAEESHHPSDVQGDAESTQEDSTIPETQNDQLQEEQDVMDRNNDDSDTSQQIEHPINDESDTSQRNENPINDESKTSQPSEHPNEMVQDMAQSDRVGQDDAIFLVFLRTTEELLKSGIILSQNQKAILNKMINKLKHLC